MIRTYMKTFLLLATVTYFVACSPVKFNSVPDVGSCQNVGGQAACIQSCDANGTCFADYDIKKQVGKGVADILFIDDNSGSMSTEQQRMADRFPTFIAGLSNVDYRIAITTTDVSGFDRASGQPVSNFPIGRDGALIDFGNGVGKFLTPSSGNVDALFKSQIKRNETLSCETSGYKTASCPSGDERGIFAANLAASRNDNGFIRSGGHMAIVVLADEDIRSKQYCNDGNSPCNSIFNLKDEDRPERFVADFKKRYPGKTVSVHSIIVADAGCENSQTNAALDIKGTIGTQYFNLSRMTGGVVGNICASDYGAQLGQISGVIADQINNIGFACSPYQNQFALFINGSPAQPSQYTVDMSKLLIDFTQPLAANTQIQLTYKCKLN